MVTRAEVQFQHHHQDVCLAAWSRCGAVLWLWPGTFPASVPAEAELHLSAPPSVQLAVAKVAAVAADFHVESASTCAIFRQGHLWFRFPKH